MKARVLHPWRVDITAARKIQERLSRRVSFSWPGRPVRRIAGADVSFPCRARALAAVVVLSYPDLVPLETAVAEGPCPMPYVPGFLSFREVPVLLDAFESLACEPDLILFDGQGMAHPRRLGLASHAGLLLNKPSIGCAKSRLFGDHDPVPRSKGSSRPLRAPGGEVIGAVLRTRTGVRPVYISVGHKIDLDTALRFVLAVSPRYRIPEPVRIADRLTKEGRRPIQVADRLTKERKRKTR